MRIATLAIVFALLAAPLAAQVVDPNKPDTELTKEEAQIRITEWQNKVNALKTRLDALDAENNSMNQELTRLATSISDCNRELYAMLGATEADVQRFRERLGRIENRVREMSRMSDQQLIALASEVDALENELNGMRKEKIALLPEFYNKIIELAREIQGLRRTKASGTYTVGTWKDDRDCLWNIAGKDQIYNDPLMWPRIWLANTDKIRNPDIIFPGQVLTIPPAGPKTDEELRAERLHYRQKASARRASVSRTNQVDQQDPGSGQ